jgi:hypothetical protein
MVIKSIIEEFNLLNNEFSSILSKISNKTKLINNIFENNTEYELSIYILINGFSNFTYLIKIYIQIKNESYFDFDLRVKKFFWAPFNCSYKDEAIIFSEKYINKTDKFFIESIKEQFFKLLPNIQEDSKNLQEIVPKELVNFIKNVFNKFDKNLKEIHGDNFKPFSGLRYFFFNEESEIFSMNPRILKSMAFEIEIEITVAKVGEYFIINGLMTSDCEDYDEYVTYSYLEMDEIKVSIDDISQCFPKLEAFMIVCETNSDKLITNCVAKWLK